MLSIVYEGKAPSVRKSRLLEMTVLASVNGTSFVVIRSNGQKNELGSYRNTC